MKYYFFVIVFYAMPISTFAYEFDTHATMTEAAFSRSIIVGSNSILKDYGISDRLNSRNAFGEHYYKVQADNAVNERSIANWTLQHMPRPNDYLTVQGWMLQGTIFEDKVYTNFDLNNDENLRIARHFFNPISHEGVILPVIGLAESAPVWALGTFDAFSRPLIFDTTRTNRLSLADAYESLYRALTNSRQSEELFPNNEDERNKYWAAVFKNIGHVTHLLQDMSQPQHTRNELHGSFPPVPGNDLNHPSGGYEYYINARATQTTVCSVTDEEPDCRIPGNRIVTNGYPTPAFNYFSDFFHVHTEESGFQSRSGLADYSNRNFFTTGHNVGQDEFPSPSNNIFDTNEYTHLDVVQESADGVGYISKKILRVANDAKFSGESESIKVTTMAAAWSDGNLDFKYVLDEDNFDDMADNLIPRGVAYSTGFIDHFFRGRMKIIGYEFNGNSYLYKLKNTSAENADFENGKLEIFYDQRFFSGNGEDIIEVKKLAEYSSYSLSHGSVDTIPVDLPAAAYREAGKIRFVYSGTIGDEYGVAGYVTDQPINGFIVNPSQSPPDGIPNPRLVYQENGSWFLQKIQKSHRGSNMDWKGWYVQGKPTKVLSWDGPISRYFSEVKYSPYVGIIDRFSNVIYEDGEILTQTPLDVYGAALTKDNAGETWIVAICAGFNKDVVYVKPYKLDSTNVLYDPDTSPFGWREIGEYTLSAQRDYRPWIFNGTGTQAQSFRDYENDDDRIQINILINSLSTQLNNHGNEVVTRADTTTRNVYPAHEGANYYYGSASGTVSIHGSTVVAVDYVGEDGTQEILARITVNEERSGGSSYDGDWPMTQWNSTTSDTYLQWGSMKVTLDKKNSSSTISRNDDAGDQTYERSADNYYNYITFLDLRSNIVSYFEVHSSIETTTATYYLITPTYNNGTARLLSTSSQPRNLSPPGQIQWNEVGGPGTESSSTTTVWDFQHVRNRYIDVTYQDSWDGSWVTDREGNIMISQELGPYGQDDGYFSYFSGGIIESIIGPGNDEAKFYPIYLK